MTVHFFIFPRRPLVILHHFSKQARASQPPAAKKQKTAEDKAHSVLIRQEVDLFAQPRQVISDSDAGPVCRAMPVENNESLSPRVGCLVTDCGFIRPLAAGRNGKGRLLAKVYVAFKRTHND